MNPWRIAARPPLETVLRLLDDAGLPCTDIEPATLGNFLFGFRPDVPEHVVGIVGVEPCESDGLLRSLVVRKEARKAGLGGALVGAAEAHARELGLNTLYLLTETAHDYFERLGYRDCDRGRAPGGVSRSREFSELCPGSASFMCKELAKS